MFNLPPNDPRLLSLTIRDALEQCFGRRAIRQYFDDAANERAEEAEGPTFDEAYDEPISTGNPEWDEEERKLTAEGAGFTPEEIEQLTGVRPPS